MPLLPFVLPLIPAKFGRCPAVQAATGLTGAGLAVVVVAVEIVVVLEAFVVRGEVGVAAAAAVVVALGMDLVGVDVAPLDGILLSVVEASVGAACRQADPGIARGEGVGWLERGGKDRCEGSTGFGWSALRCT
jgi:hypothetical protein